MGVGDACGRSHWDFRWSSLWGHETCEGCAELGVSSLHQTISSRRCGSRLTYPACLYTQMDLSSVWGLLSTRVLPSPDRSPSVERPQQYDIGPPPQLPEPRVVGENTRTYFGDQGLSELSLIGIDWVVKVLSLAALRSFADIDVQAMYAVYPPAYHKSLWICYLIGQHQPQEFLDVLEKMFLQTMRVEQAPNAASLPPRRDASQFEYEEHQRNGLTDRSMPLLPLQLHAVSFAFTIYLPAWHTDPPNN